MVKRASVACLKSTRTDEIEADHSTLYASREVLGSGDGSLKQAVVALRFLDAEHLQMHTRTA